MNGTCAIFPNPRMQDLKAPWILNDRENCDHSTGCLDHHRSFGSALGMLRDWATMTIPQDPPIFHITHVDNLPSILRDGALWCDAQRIARGLSHTNIGHVHIKQRRLSRPLMTPAGGTLGDYVPFNFCPRSVMLFAVHRGHQDYNGGQDHVVHLVSSVSRAIATGRPWAFTDRHAELAHALHFDDLAQLSEVAWHVMAERYWTSVKEERQAEFLVRDFFPWEAIGEVATMIPEVAAKAQSALQLAGYQTRVTTRPGWYYS